MVEQEVLDCMNDIINTVVKKEYQKEYQKKYRKNNKEKQKEYKKKYYGNNKEKQKEYGKKYYDKKKDKLLEQKKEYRKTINGIKSNKINSWKRQGVVCNNFEALYNHYTSTAYCDYCRVELTIDKKITSTMKCLDHCHETGLFRNILCHSCNCKRRQNNF